VKNPPPGALRVVLFTLCMMTLDALRVIRTQDFEFSNLESLSLQCRDRSLAGEMPHYESGSVKALRDPFRQPPRNLREVGLAPQCRSCAAKPLILPNKLTHILHLDR
jgi:hypothetical protein